MAPHEKEHVQYYLERWFGGRFDQDEVTIFYFENE